MTLSLLSHDRSLWLAVLHRQQHEQNLPLPSFTYHPLALVKISTSELEAITASAYQVDRSWLSPRDSGIDQAARSLRPKPAQYLLSLDLFLDRWLLCVYGEGVVSLWDLQPDGRNLQNAQSKIDQQNSVPGRLRLTFVRRGWRGERGWASCVSALHEDRQSLVLACAKSEG